MKMYSCGMNKITIILTFFIFLFSYAGFAQLGGDGSYLWNSTSITYSVNKKTELVFSNKDHFNNQISRLDYYHFEFYAYHELIRNFSLGLGFRQNETLKTGRWSPGNAWFFYGVSYLHPGSIKIKFSNRFAIRTYRLSETQYTFDNNTIIDFFSQSTRKLPKPFLQDELFTNLKEQKVQTVRLYGGLHLLKSLHWGLDLYYCYTTTWSSWIWKKYNVFGLSTKFSI